MTEEAAIKLSSHEIEEVVTTNITQREAWRTWEDVIWQEFSLNLIMCVIFPTGMMKSLCSRAEESLEDSGMAVPGGG